MLIGCLSFFSYIAIERMTNHCFYFRTSPFLYFSFFIIFSYEEASFDRLTNGEKGTDAE